MLIIEETDSSDLAAYISDDFELISYHLLTNDKNSWVTSLCASYFEKKIPQGELILKEKTLNELINLQQT